jgi:hypothetical protein
VLRKFGDVPDDLGTDDRESLQDRWEPAIELNEKPAIAVRQLGPPPHLTPQDSQLMSERRILCLKQALRLELRSQDGQYKVGQRDHCANLADSIAQELGIRFSVHTARIRRQFTEDDIAEAYRYVEARSNALARYDRKRGK